MKLFWHLLPCATLALLSAPGVGCAPSASTPDALLGFPADTAASEAVAPQPPTHRPSIPAPPPVDAAAQEAGATDSTTRPQNTPDAGTPASGNPGGTAQKQDPDVGTPEPAQPPVIDYFKKVPPEDPRKADRLRGYTQRLDSGNENSRTVAIEDLLKMNDPVVIPYLLPTLGMEGDFEDKLRVRITMGLLRMFPEQCVELFAQMLERGSLIQKQTAAYAMGRAAHPRMAELLLPFVTHEDEKLRRAAISGATTVGSYVHNYYENFALQKAGKQPVVMPEPPRALIKRVHEVVDGLMEIILAADLDLTEEPFMILRQFGTHDTARRLMAHFASKVEEERRPVAEVLTRMQHVNRRWLGRPEPMPAELVEYEFWMMNLKPDPPKTKEFIIMFDRDTLDMLRGRARPMHLDRGTTLQIPSDDLMMYPQICDPQLEEETEAKMTLRYRMPLMAEVRAGIGAANIGYWVSATRGAAESVLTIDTERGVPLSEQVFNPDDELVAEIVYGDYQELGEEALVPLTIHLEVIQISTKRRKHMKYEFHYKIESGMWLFDEGTAFEVDEESGTLTERALAETRNLSIVEASEGPDLDEREKPETRKKPR